MKIISKFKDYYDYVAHQYGEGDPLIRYERKNLPKNEYKLEGRIPFYYSWKFNLNTNEIAFPLLVVMNHAYILHKNKIYNYEDRKINEILFNRNLFHKECYDLGIEKYEDKLNLLKNKFRNKSVGICRVVSQPVFLLGSCYSSSGNRNDIQVFNKIPNLGELGFASIMSPEQLYQELAFFIGNSLKKTEKISEVSNKDKILQAGFDLKTSFRGK